MPTRLKSVSPRTCSGRLLSGAGSALGTSGAGARASACEKAGWLIVGARQGAPGYGAARAEVPVARIAR